MSPAIPVTGDGGPGAVDCGKHVRLVEPDARSMVRLPGIRSWKNPPGSEGEPGARTVAAARGLGALESSRAGEVRWGCMNIARAHT